MVGLDSSSRDIGDSRLLVWSSGSLEDKSKFANAYANAEILYF